MLCSSASYIILMINIIPIEVILTILCGKADMRRV